MSQTTFDQRVSGIHKRHRALANGASYRVSPDGLIVAVPNRRVVPRFPVKSLLMLVAGAFAFKAALFIASGEGTYNGRLAELEKGRPLEQVMAWLMQPDPVTRGMAASVGLVYHMAAGENP